MLRCRQLIKVVCCIYEEIWFELMRTFVKRICFIKMMAQGIVKICCLQIFSNVMVQNYLFSNTRLEKEFEFMYEHIHSLFEFKKFNIFHIPL